MLVPWQAGRQTGLHIARATRQPQSTLPGPGVQSNHTGQGMQPSNLACCCTGQAHTAALLLRYRPAMAPNAQIGQRHGREAARILSSIHHVWEEALRSWRSWPPEIGRPHSYLARGLLLHRATQQRHNMCYLETVAGCTCAVIDPQTSTSCGAPGHHAVCPPCCCSLAAEALPPPPPEAVTAAAAPPPELLPFPPPCPREPP